MSLTVVGSVALDTVSSPFGRVERELGGSATYAALTAAFFTPVSIVAPVGEDFGSEERGALEHRNLNRGGLEVRQGPTFTWTAHYDFDMSVAHTDAIELNVFQGWRPRLSDGARESDSLFLGALDPEIQIDVRRQWRGAKWSALDSNEYWIRSKPDALREAISQVDIVLMNDLEARRLTERPMLLQAARRIISWGPRAVVLRFGEYGCTVLTEGDYFSLPGYPLEQAADPTGCGDAFAGGFLGYLDLVRGSALTEEVLRRATFYGAVMSSYCYEEFGARRLGLLSEHEVSYRLGELQRMTHFEHVPTEPMPRGGEDGHAALERPPLTPSTQPLAAPAPASGTPEYRSPGRTPSTEPLPRPGRPNGRG